MKTESSEVRNTAIIGHGSTGKTSLFEQALVQDGHVPKFVPVDNGKSVSDHTPEEIGRGISIHTALGSVLWNKTKINLLDTPGSADFVGEVVAALHVAETAIVTVGADVGVQIETAKLWRRLDSTKKPRIVFINQMDKEHADFDKVLSDLREKLTGNFVPILIPIGQGSNFSGILDLLNSKTLSHTGSKEKIGEIPDDLVDVAEQFRQQLNEGAAEGNDELMEKYLEEDSLSEDEIRSGLSESLCKNLVVPVIAGSATLNSGLCSLLDLVQMAAPSPLNKSSKPKEVTTKETTAFVYKTSLDRYSGKLSWIKMMQGDLVPDSELISTRDGKKERINKLYTLQGSSLVGCSYLPEGDLGVLSKLEGVITGDSLSNQPETESSPLDLPQPIHLVSVSTASKKDEDKLGQFLSRITEEDPTFKARYDGETEETVISAMGELQLSIALSRLKESTKIEVETNVPRIAYRETITGSAAAEFQHKKQTGGHGQYAKVEIKIKPLSQPEQFKFINQIVGGAVSRGYIPGVEKGLKEGMHSGILAGFPVMGIEATLTDGKEHSVDSSELAFSLAARGALRTAIEQAKPVLLEPIPSLTVNVEESYIGDVLSDLSSRRGRIQGQEQTGNGILEIKALVPQAELMRYSIDLKSMTSGTASFETEFDHYSPLQGRLAEDVINRSRNADDKNNERQ